MLFFDGLELRVLHEYLEAGLDDLEEACAQSGFFVLKENTFLVSQAKLRPSKIFRDLVRCWKILGDHQMSWEIIRYSERP